MTFAKCIFGAFALVAACFASMAVASNWNLVVERVDGRHVIGKPGAGTVLTEFVSYTCPHCGTFARSGDEALKLAYVGPGKLRLEIRHIVRDPVDLTAALLTWCGDKDKFLRNHAAFMHAQPKWLETARRTTPAQQQRWAAGPWPARFRAIASDLDFYDIMERRGYRRTEVDRCLADTALAETLAGNSGRDADTFMVPGTPSFALDGELLAGVHTWPALQEALSSVE